MRNYFELSEETWKQMGRAEFVYAKLRGHPEIWRAKIVREFLRLTSDRIPDRTIYFDKARVIERDLEIGAGGQMLAMQDIEGCTYDVYLFTDAPVIEMPRENERITYWAKCGEVFDGVLTVDGVLQKAAEQIVNGQIAPPTLFHISRGGKSIVLRGETVYKLTEVL